MKHSLMEMMVRRALAIVSSTFEFIRDLPFGSCGSRLSVQGFDTAIPADFVSENRSHLIARGGLIQPASLSGLSMYVSTSRRYGSIRALKRVSENHKGNRKPEGFAKADLSAWPLLDTNPVSVSALAILHGTKNGRKLRIASHAGWRRLVLLREQENPWNKSEKSRYCSSRVLVRSSTRRLLVATFTIRPWASVSKRRMMAIFTRRL